MRTMRMQILVCGLGGQGVLFATEMISRAAAAEGFGVIGSETHGMAQRGGAVVSHLKIGEYLSPLVRGGRADLILALQREEAFRWLPFVARDGAIVVNCAELRPGQRECLATMDGVRLFEMDAAAAAAACGNVRAANVALVAFACGLGLLPFERRRMEELLRELSRPRFLEGNLAALAAGYDAAAERASRNRNERRR